MPKGSNSADLLRMNEIRLLQLLLRADETSRAMLSRTMEITQAGISKLTARLIEGGLVHETGYHEGEKGRRSIGVCVSRHVMVLAARLTHTGVELQVMNARREILHTAFEKLDLKKSGSMTILRAAIDDCIDKFPGIAAIGLAAPSPLVLLEKQTLLYPSYGMCRPLDLRRELSPERFGDRPVLTMRYAQAAAMRDWWLNARDVAYQGTLVHVELDDEVGAGIVTDGVPKCGAHGSAGEIGHVSLNPEGARCECGGRGCMSAYCSRDAFMRYVDEQRASMPDSPLNAKAVIAPEDVFALAMHGDALARSCVAFLGEYTGRGIALLINTLDPSAIVIGGALACGGGALLDGIKCAVKTRVHPELYERVTMELDPEPGVLTGAATYALLHVMNDPDSLSERLRITREKELLGNP